MLFFYRYFASGKLIWIDFINESHFLRTHIFSVSSVFFIIFSLFLFRPISYLRTVLDQSAKGLHCWYCLGNIFSLYLTLSLSLFLSFRFVKNLPTVLDHCAGGLHCGYCLGKDCSDQYVFNWTTVKTIIFTGVETKRQKKNAIEREILRKRRRKKCDKGDMNGNEN